MSRLLSSGLAGAWYPSDPVELREVIDDFLEGPSADRGHPVPPGADVVAFVVPHAGYRYSGEVAGLAWGLVPRGRWRRAVIAGPSHFDRFEGVAVADADGFATPIGEVAIDRRSLEPLRTRRRVQDRPGAFEREHSIEIQLPFLVRVDETLPVVPLLVSGSAAALDEAAGIFSSLDDGETLFVLSSDFTHYGESFDYLPFPPDDASFVREALRDLDGAVIEPVLARDRTRFVEELGRTGATVCGRPPLEAWLGSTPAVGNGILLDYRTSLDVTGDYRHCVSYAAIAFPRELHG